MLSANPPSSYACDTIPAPRLAQKPSNTQLPALAPVVLDDEQHQHMDIPTPSPVTPRKLCVRHLRMADEGTNLKLQQSLDALPYEERKAVNAIWANFSSSSHPRRALILQGLLTMCCFSQLSLLTEQLAHLIRLDPFAILPSEVAMKVLGYLDATSLCRAAQVSRQWKTLADDDILWKGICEQHIGQKCRKCGWGLPILEKHRAYRAPGDDSVAALLPPSSPASSKRMLEESGEAPSRPFKRQKSEHAHNHHVHHQETPSAPSFSPNHADSDSDSHTNTLLARKPPLTHSLTRPWKDVYSERLTIERNWRRGRCTVRTLKGHTDGVMCLQFKEMLTRPAFPVLITGSYDRTVRVWNMETGMELHCLRGHTRAVRALQFDEVKLITGSMDNTLRVWDWRKGQCIRTLTGHTQGVVCLNFDSNVLASGSVDQTIKVWNLRTGGAFTLRGHSDWVNAVQLWDSSPCPSPSTSTSGMSLFDSVPVAGSSSPPSQSNSQIDRGKMLFSASDDGTIRLWDLTQRACVRQFMGHMGQVQSMKLLLVDGCIETETTDTSSESDVPVDHPGYDSLTASPEHRTKTQSPSPTLTNSVLPSTSTTTVATKKPPTPVLISGSLDNTIKVWDIETGETKQTLFGHIEGVWAVVSDKLRLVSGSQDRTIKVWNREDGRCTATLVGHCGAVNCLALGEDKIVSGSDDGDIKIWGFSG